MEGDRKPYAHIVDVPKLEIDINDTKAVQQYLKKIFQEKTSISNTMADLWRFITLD